MKIARKLILSIISLVGVVACFSVSTYAWFKVNSEAAVEGFDFEVNGGLGFMVSIDNKNYSNALTTEQMKMAIVRGSNPSKYIIEDNKLKEVKGTGDNKEYIEVSQDMIDTIIEGIKESPEVDPVAPLLQLSPITSTDGVRFYNKSGTELTDLNKTQYISFDIYFKATSDNPNDKVSYDIYLRDEEKTLLDGKTKLKTEIVAKNPDTISLVADMTIFDDERNGGVTIGPNRERTTIEVHTSNALRLSIQDVTELDDDNKPAAPEGEEVAPKPVSEATIYELTNSKDLGSYATNYNNDEHLQISKEDKLYNSNFNAMYTYYNNLRQNAQLTKPLDYESVPKTIRSPLITEKEIEALGGIPQKQIITTVDSAGGPRRVTFRLWLEGWDADCFDGLQSSIGIKLLFDSKKHKQEI